MNIILLEKVQNLGKLGDQIKVKNGYARNFLLPQGKAVLATPENVARFEQRRAELEQAEAEVLAKAQTRRDAIQGKSLTISAKAGDEGKLFGSVGTADISEAAEACIAMRSACQAAHSATLAVMRWRSTCIRMWTHTSRSTWWRRRARSNNPSPPAGLSSVVDCAAEQVAVKPCRRTGLRRAMSSRNG